MTAAIVRELEHRMDFFSGGDIETVYFGGGTPSLISSVNLLTIVRKVRESFPLSEDAELTLEANPEDIDRERLIQWKSLGFNRLSIGIQSFDDIALTSMNRAHDAKQGLEAVRAAKQIGFENISVDLIYGLPGSDESTLLKDLAIFIDLGVQHISAYALTIEPATLYAHKLRKGEIEIPEEDEIADQFQIIKEILSKFGYDQYEVSNFCKSGFESRHNSSYWSGRPYLGIGPSAHSFDGYTRSWNISNNFRYMTAIEKNENQREEEIVDERMRYNEYILTRSRTKWGLDLKYIDQVLGVDLLSRFSAELDRYKGTYTILDEHLILNSEGLLRADGFASDLFLAD